MKTSSRSRPGAALALVAACCLVFSGCEAGSSVAPFSGVVSYQGAPLQFGSVTMQPVSGGPVARGDIQPDGSFELQTDGRPGATIGQNRVRVICYSSQSPEATAASAGDEASVGKSLIPERYSRFSSSGLVLDVKLGQQEPVKIELSR